MKKETVEEAKESYLDSPLPHSYKRAVEFGAKWQQEHILSLDKEGLVKTDNDKLLFQVGVLKGMEHQLESSYSEKDMLKFMQFIISNEELENTTGVSTDTAKYYLNQFKKK